MISVDISNVWCRVSLPEVLGNEQTVAQAHQLLAGIDWKQGESYGWLTRSLAMRRDTLEQLQAAAEKLRSQSRVIVVLGSGAAYAGVRAAIRLSMGRLSPVPRLLFAGEHPSPDDWADVLTALDGVDFSVIALCETGNEIPPLIALRSLRWIMDKRYGAGMKERIVICAPAGSNAMANLAETEGYAFWSAPQETGAPKSALQPGALLTLAAAGRSADLLWQGALSQLELCDERTMENPAWMMAAAETALQKKGMRRALLCTPEPAAAELGRWWSHLITSCGCKNGGGAWADAVRLPEELPLIAESLLDPRQMQYLTMLRLQPSAKNTAVEMAWRDPDRISALTGLTLSSVSETMLDTVAEAVFGANVPLIVVRCEEDLTDDKIGELLYFAEFSAALSAKTAGADPYAQAETRSLFRAIDHRLGRE